MLKQYFTDGLVQIAIVLSLLRTDLNNYLSHNYVNYPEVQEAILGQTAAYTQTNFHNSFNRFSHLGSPEIYRKNIDSYDIFETAFYRDLRSFQPVSRGNLNYDAFLLVIGQSGPSYHTQETSEQSTDNNVDNNNNNNNIESEQSLSSEDLEEEGQHLLHTLEESIGAIAPFIHNLQAADPTREDLDLIEVLWRQDIDLGVGKEVYDPNLRRELERERELELQKERQKQKDQELLQKKLEEQRHHTEQQWLSDNFTQDGETGEWVPLGGARVPPLPPAPDLGARTDGEQQFLPQYDNMLPQQPDQQGTSYSVAQQGVRHMPPPQYPGPSSLHPQTSQMYGGGQYGQTPGTSQGYRAPPQNLPVYPQAQQHFNNTPDYTTQQQNYSQMQPHLQQHQHQQGYPRQSSLEATWQDLVHILDLPPNATNSSSQSPETGGPMMNVQAMSQMGGSNLPPLDNSSITQMDNTSSMLIQNASMPTPAPMNGNMTFNNSGIVNPTSHRSPPHSSGLLSPTESYNSSIPNNGDLSPLSWEPCGNFLFPNISSNMTHAESLEDVDELLPDLITEDELDVDEINFAEMGLNDGVTSPPQGFSEDASSDSALGSQSAGSPDQNDFSDSAMSPYDGLEGATGGHDSHPFPKTSKYDPDDYKYSNSCSYSCGDSNSSNFSSSSNDTNGGGHYSQSNGSGGGHFSPASNGHINHNHSYPLKPGSDPKDFKKHYLNNNKEGKHKGPQSKDSKRIEELKVPFTLDQIVNSPVEEFNDMLTRHKLNDQQMQLIRDIRRRGKNKVAAQNCRKRKIGVLETLEEEMTRMEKMRDKLIRERHLMEKQTREMKDKLGGLYSDIFHSLRDENGQPYDPARYSLQQSSDGDVFLVPRNYTMEEELNKKRKNERK